MSDQRGCSWADGRRERAVWDCLGDSRRTGELGGQAGVDWVAFGKGGGAGAVGWVVGGVPGDEDRGGGQPLGWRVEPEAGFEEAAGRAEQGAAEQNRDEDREEGRGAVPQGGEGEADHGSALRAGQATGAEPREFRGDVLGGRVG